MNSTYIGVLLSKDIYNGIPRGRTKFENLVFYEEAAEKFGLTVCFFRLADISPKNELITAYVKVNGMYKKTSVPTPKIIHNRVRTFTSKDKEKMKSLLNSGTFIFNQENRFNKFKIHEILLGNEDIWPFLPETLKANKTNIFLMLEKHGSLIIKPTVNSLGIGVMNVERIGNENVLAYINRKAKSVNTVTFTDELPKILLNLISKKSYLVQQRIPLATFEGNPFDLRVTVQRNETGDWQLTGIVGKVAKPGLFVTNVAGGGRALRLEHLLNQKTDIEEVKNNIAKLALNIAKQLENKLPSLADIGLDIGLTEDGIPMFIECNGRALRRTYKQACMMDAWKATHANPIGYGKYLIDRLAKD